MPEPKYPLINAKVSQYNGRIEPVVGTIKRAMKRAGVPQHEIDAFVREAMASDFDHVLKVCMTYVNVR